jgi:hypothetical protein
MVVANVIAFGGLQSDRQRRWRRVKRRALDEWIQQPGGNAYRDLARRYFEEHRQLEKMIALYRRLTGTEPPGAGPEADHSAL